MKTFNILFVFAVLFVLLFAAFAIADSNETEDDDSNDVNETEDDDSNDVNETEDDDIDDDSNERLRERMRELREDYREDRGELREDYREGIRNETGEYRYEIKELIKDYRSDRKELMEEYKIRIRGENVTFNITDDEKLEIIVGKINARTGLNLSVEDLENVSLGQVLRAYLSNGRWAEVKYMPDQASEVALERLRAKCEERNCTVELREIHNNKTNESMMVYDVETEKDSRVFGLFKNKMKVKAQVDAETGEVVYARKPWWAFLASEKDE